ncbi:TPA: type II toxin-antitoxin system PemK/MazF family toxin [Staphylococcus aureus]|jgi:hypothetical protein|uniref:Endoribonuclease MazF n=1 Tax=Staphylococcus aureus TaxID=1280 RepID=A0A517JLE5_STAAU|nr:MULTISPECIES: type II toxin-antitoxin system PemK/MazF family toxin [Staphylococcus]HAR4209739.1 type II toxin-antitoxin system PemK/MazF family toxin [Staphylococcus aureus ADL-210]HAR4233100.1 type II toxin-antitoxin system PemK/MazF family toxin [Staphylococcus aureus ADL-206]HDH6440687.1 type II toxin-antitoxin system PemK/MazF family toxin [Staphylococcus aureus MRSA-Lux-26]HDH6443885.1 type II toxin-antitoxin system PemK/MazF family toxin [Staphylococcus aureus MRSA-Lux-25]HDH6446479.
MERNSTKKSSKDKILKAVNNFEEVCNSGKFKFKYLDDWLFTKSIIFKNETTLTNQKNFKVYPRGTIVYAKLGVNIGSEFSGNHFCVVLNKNDNKRNELITIVPLTSKDTKFSLKLQENLILKALEKMKTDHKTLRFDLDRIKEMHARSTKVKNLNSAIEKELDEIENNYMQLAKIIERYERFVGKQTYAIPSQVITISKKRISTLNDYDPTGHISFNEETLKIIEDFMKANILS